MLAAPSSGTPFPLPASRRQGLTRNFPAFYTIHTRDTLIRATILTGSMLPLAISDGEGAGG